jgi:hypothetical protein
MGKIGKDNTAYKLYTVFLRYGQTSFFRLHFINVPISILTAFSALVKSVSLQIEKSKRQEIDNNFHEFYLSYKIFFFIQKGCYN